MTGSVPVLGRRALNRALLQRQHLLERSDLTVLELVDHLVGMQAQAPLAPYGGAWTRRTGFTPDTMSQQLADRNLVRAWMMRCTVHLLTGADALAFRPLLRPVSARHLQGHFGRVLGEVDTDAVARYGEQLLTERPRTRVELRQLLAARWPEHDPTLLTRVVSYLNSTAQTTPRGLWGHSAPATLTTLPAWLGAPISDRPDVDALVQRYRRAFGPASVLDMQTWSGLTRLREVVERLRPSLRVYRDETGAELFDVRHPAPQPPANRAKQDEATKPTKRAS